MSKGRSLTETAVGNLHIDKDKAFEFFAAYARYEYAAKACRYVQKQPGDLRLQPSDIANAVDEGFKLRLAADANLKKAVDYYTSDPPQKAIWDGQGPSWTSVARTEKGTLRLLLDLAQARNNLFHGGKAWKRAESVRDNDLIAHGLVILEAVIASDNGLSQEFSSFG